jgi:hypothetical protein
MDEKTDPDWGLLLPELEDSADCWLEYYRKRFEWGDQDSLLSAIYVAANHQVNIPPWAAAAFTDALQSVSARFEFKSWDDVFGTPFPKGVHLAALRNTRKAISIWGEIEKRRKVSGTKRDAALFEEVGRKYGVGKTLCSELYYGQLKAFKRGEALMARRQKSRKS